MRINLEDTEAQSRFFVVFFLWSNIVVFFGECTTEPVTGRRTSYWLLISFQPDWKRNRMYSTYFLHIFLSSLISIWFPFDNIYSTCTTSTYVAYNNIESNVFINNLKTYKFSPLEVEVKQHKQSKCYFILNRYY